MIEYSRRGRNHLEVMIAGLTRATNLPRESIESLVYTDSVDTLFGLDGKIRPMWRRRMSGIEARAKLAERKPDGSPRRRCEVCGDVCDRDNDWRCYCNRRRGPDEPPYGGWPSVSAKGPR